MVLGFFYHHTKQWMCYLSRYTNPYENSTFINIFYNTETSLLQIVFPCIMISITCRQANIDTERMVVRSISGFLSGVFLQLSAANHLIFQFLHLFGNSGSLRN